MTSFQSRYFQLSMMGCGDGEDALSRIATNNPSVDASPHADPLSIYLDKLLALR